MYKAADVDARIASMKTEGRSKADIIDTASDMCIGWPYVFGAAGEMCTPDNRKKYAGYRPDKKPDIFGACPALSGKGTCDSCKWCGTRIFDCRGFTRWLLAQVGLTLYGGTVTAQWETASNWVYKGNIDKMPLSLACCVFREGHTGMHLFGDVTRHCNKYVKEQLLPGVPRWLRFGIPAGLYKTEELRRRRHLRPENLAGAGRESFCRRRQNNPGRRKPARGCRGGYDPPAAGRQRHG